MRSANPIISMRRRPKAARLLWAMILLFTVSSCIDAQTITVLLINATSGKPIQGQHVSIVWGGQFSRSDQYPLSDKLGGVHVDIPPHAKSLTLLAGPKVGKEPNRIPYIVCGRYGEISVEEALNSGVTTENQCDPSVRPVPKAGEIIYLIKLLPSWMPDVQ
jgi:hypothetical protein